jgi:hypothetical protein
VGTLALVIFGIVGILTDGSPEPSTSPAENAEKTVGVTAGWGLWDLVPVAILAVLAVLSLAVAIKLFRWLMGGSTGIGPYLRPLLGALPLVVAFLFIAFASGMVPGPGSWFGAWGLPGPKEIGIWAWRYVLYIGIEALLLIAIVYVLAPQKVAWKMTLSMAGIAAALFLVAPVFGYAYEDFASYKETGVVKVIHAPPPAFRCPPFSPNRTSECMLNDRQWAVMDPDRIYAHGEYTFCWDTGEGSPPPDEQKNGDTRRYRSQPGLKSQLMLYRLVPGRAQPGRCPTKL